MSLVSLPTEILFAIVEHIRPDTLVPFATSCKLLFQCSQQALSLHRERLSGYRRVHDRDPQELLRIFKLFLGDDRLAWYIRGLEVWDLRKSFKRWVTTRLFVENELQDALHWPEKPVDCRALAGQTELIFSATEWATMESVLSNTLMLPKEGVEIWMNRAAAGSDEVLKAILMAIAPALSHIVFVRQRCWDNEDHAPDEPITLLCSSIRRIHNSGLEWHCFRSLRTVVVGKGTDYRHPHDSFYLDTKFVAPLFLLPAIDVLDLIVWESRPDDAYEYEWGPGTSNCSHLEIEPMAEETHRPILSLVAACRELRKIRWGRWPLKEYKEKMLDLLLSQFGQTLESLDAWQVGEDDRWNKGMELSKQGRSFSCLVSLEMSVHELVDLDRSVRAPDTPNRPFGSSVWLEIPKILGKSMGTIQELIITSATYSGDSLLEHEVPSFQLMLLEFLKSDPPNLRLVCLHGIRMPGMDSSEEGTGPELSRLLPDFVKVCSDCGYTVHFWDGKWKEPLDCKGCTMCATNSEQEITTLPEKPSLREYYGSDSDDEKGTASEHGDEHNDESEEVNVGEEIAETDSQKKGDGDSPSSPGLQDIYRKRAV